jgi:hypothetical protein
MSDTAQGPGWWMASDHKWYPPERHPGWTASIPQPFSATPVGAPEDALASWAPALAPAFPAAPPAPVPTRVGSALPIPGGYLDLDGRPAEGPGNAFFGGPPVAHPIDPAPDGGRASRGLRLVGTGFAMAKEEPGLMLVPVVACVIQALIVAVAIAVLYPSLHALHTADVDGTPAAMHLSVGQWLVLVVAGVATMYSSVVSHATIIARVMARFHGQRVSNLQAARAALTQSLPLLAWAFINYVVLSILRNIRNRGILGLLVGGLLRAGWQLASFFVVPVILFEDKGAVAAIKESAHLCRSRWGENIVGNGALWVIGFVAFLLDALVAAVLGMAFAPLGVAVGVVGVIAILLVLTVASASFNAALYWFAVTGQAPGQYALGDLEGAYRQKGRRTGLYGV